ncbi:MAG: diaminopimelate epimerase [Tepidisphaeraceae bacterium]|jgi:diaminopimelate epimerase
MKFTKMHGIGNDYVYVNGFTETIADPAQLAKAVSDRHFGIGADGLILILPSDRADVKMRMFNADGSEAEMCGNGIRCVAKYAYEHHLSPNNPISVETGGRVLSLQLQLRADRVTEVTVNMGAPILALPKIPVDPEKVRKISDVQYELAVGGQNFPAIFVSMGNPHAVIFTDDVAGVDVPDLGPKLEHFSAFPRRMNVHWVQPISRSEVIMRTWERGSGITLACGTGACAVCVAGILAGKTDRKILAHLPGGDLKLDWRQDDNNVFMTGPATEVFSGEWPGS